MTSVGAAIESSSDCTASMVPFCMAPEQLAGGDQLIGVIELDLHLAIGGLVERIDRGFDHMLGQRRAGIGLQAPSDRRLCVHRRRSQRRSTRTDRSGGGIFEKITSRLVMTALPIFLEPQALVE